MSGNSSGNINSLWGELFSPISKSLKNSRKALFVVISGLVVGCSNEHEAPRGSPNSWPTSYWLNDADPCIRASAAAIINSGLPYPNLVRSPDGEITSTDMWIGEVRLVIPAAVGSTLGYPDHHPRRHWNLLGSLPNFYPVGPAAKHVGRVGPSVFVEFSCSMDRAFTDRWGRGYKSNKEGITARKAYYENEPVLKEMSPPIVKVIRREDIGMIEVLKEYSLRSSGDKVSEATYWPIDRELRGLDGTVSGIGCRSRNYSGSNYDDKYWDCTSSMRITRNAIAKITVYVPYVKYMPVVYDQVKEIIEQGILRGSKK